MLSPLKIQDALRNYSEEQLKNEMTNPTGIAPQYLVMTELQRRKIMSNKAIGEKYPEKSMAEEAVQSEPKLNSILAGLGGLPPAGMRGAEMQSRATGRPVEYDGKDVMVADEGMIADESNAMAGGGSVEPDYNRSLFLAKQRAVFGKELENPDTRKLLGAIHHAENPGAGPGVIESLMNRTELVNSQRAARDMSPLTLEDMIRGHSSLDRGKSFYGPMRSGKINDYLLKMDDPKYAAAADANIASALGGSNTIRGYTDQGSSGDSNYETGGMGININKERFNDWGLSGSAKWRKDREAEVAQYGAAQPAAADGASTPSYSGRDGIAGLLAESGTGAGAGAETAAAPTNNDKSIDAIAGLIRTQMGQEQTIPRGPVYTSYGAREEEDPIADLINQKRVMEAERNRRAYASRGSVGLMARGGQVRQAFLDAPLKASLALQKKRDEDIAFLHRGAEGIKTIKAAHGGVIRFRDGDTVQNPDALDSRSAIDRAEPAGPENRNTKYTAFGDPVPTQAEIDRINLLRSPTTAADIFVGAPTNLATDLAEGTVNLGRRITNALGLTNAIDPITVPRFAGRGLTPYYDRFLRQGDQILEQKNAENAQALEVAPALAPPVREPRARPPDLGAAPAPATAPAPAPAPTSLDMYLTELRDREKAIKAEYANAKEKSEKERASDKWLALAQAGFGMAAGTSPYAATNIGGGFSQGIASMRTADAARRASDLAYAKEHRTELRDISKGGLDERRLAEAEKVRLAAELKARVAAAEMTAYHVGQYITTSKNSINNLQGRISANPAMGDDEKKSINDQITRERENIKHYEIKLDEIRGVARPINRQPSEASGTNRTKSNVVWSGELP